MKKERDARAKEYTEQGKVVASRTRAEAEKKAADIIEEAETEAMKKRSEADAKAAESYAAFSQHPQLASFLRRLASLRETLDQESTLILDTNTPPFDLLKPDAMNIERFADPKDQSPAGTSEATEGGVKDGQ
jgi:membrane protease subunit HflC